MEKNKLIEEEVRALFSAVEDSLPAPDRQFLGEEIDAHEWAVVLDQVLFMAERRGLAMTGEARGLLDRSLELTGLDAETMRSAWPKP